MKNIETTSNKASWFKGRIGGEKIRSVNVSKNVEIELISAKRVKDSSMMTVKRRWEQVTHPRSLRNDVLGHTGLLVMTKIVDLDPSWAWISRQ